MGTGSVGHLLRCRPGCALLWDTDEVVSGHLQAKQLIVSPGPHALSYTFPDGENSVVLTSFSNSSVLKF